MSKHTLNRVLDVVAESSIPPATNAGGIEDLGPNWVEILNDLQRQGHTVEMIRIQDGTLRSRLTPRTSKLQSAWRPLWLRVWTARQEAPGPVESPFGDR